MKRESFQGILLGIVIMCAVFAFITIAWAAFRTNLSINGTATIASQKWQVEFTSTKDTQFSSLSDVSITANTHSTSASAGTFTITDNGFKVGYGSLGSSGTAENIGTLNQSGDKISYTWYVQNFGTFGADVTFTGLKSALTSQSDTSNYDNTGSNVTITCKNAGGDSSKDAAAQTWCNKYVKAVLTVDSTAVTSSSSIALNKSTATTNDSDVKTVVLSVEVTQDQPTSGGAKTDVVTTDAITVEISGIVLVAQQSATTQAVS